MRGQKLDPDGGNDQPIQGYIDEMPLRTGEMFLQMYDTERVEILKGSQGTLQGVVGSGGALHILHSICASWQWREKWLCKNYLWQTI